MTPTQLKSTKKKIIIRKLTRGKLGKYLEKIGWKLSLDKYNGVIVNNQGKKDAETAVMKRIEQISSGCSDHRLRSVPHDCSECREGVITKADILDVIKKIKGS